VRRTRERFRIEHCRQRRRYHFRSSSHDACSSRTVCDHRFAWRVTEQKGQHGPKAQRFVEEMAKRAAKLVHVLSRVALLFLIELDRYRLRLLQRARMREDPVNRLGARPHDSRSPCRKKTGEITTYPILIEPARPAGNAKPLDRAW